MSILEAFRDDEYRIDNLQAVLYSRTNPMFEEGYLGRIYGLMKGDRFSSRRPNGTGILGSLFFGMDVSWESIVSYLSKTPVIVMGEWRGEEFNPAGIIFRTVVVGGGKSAMMGYTFFREYWGSDYSEVLTILGLSLAFQEFKLEAIHGLRYSDNNLTKNFLTPVGFKDTGVLPRWEMRRGQLVDAVTSCLLREDFESYVERRLIEAYAAAK